VCVEFCGRNDRFGITSREDDGSSEWDIEIDNINQMAESEGPPPF